MPLYVVPGGLSTIRASTPPLPGHPTASPAILRPVDSPPMRAAALEPRLSISWAKRLPVLGSYSPAST